MKAEHWKVLAGTLVGIAIGGALAALATAASGVAITGWAVAAFIAVLLVIRVWKWA